MQLGQRIRALRKEKGLTLEQVAIPAGTDTGNLSRIERGVQTPTGTELLSSIARVLGVSLSDLTEPEVLGSSARASGGITGQVVVREMFPGRVPLLPWGRFGDWAALTSDSMQLFEWVPCSKRFAYGTAAAAVLDSDSMAREAHPSFPAGAILIVHAADSAQNGDYVLVRTPSGPVFKRLAVDAGEMFLQSLNSAFPMRPLGEGVIVGILHEALIKVAP